MMSDRHTEQYLTKLAEMEQNWQTAVDKALSVREDQLSTAKQVIVSLKAQIQQLQTDLEARDKENDSLKRSLLESNRTLDSTREDMATILESSQKQLEDINLEHAKQLIAKDREIDDLRSRHKHSILELTRGTQQTLNELEAQYEAVKLEEGEIKRQLEKSQAVTLQQARKLQEWDRVSEKMCQELDEVKGKLKSSKFANLKLREEVNLWKKYTEKVEEEKESIRRDIELEKKVLNKFNQVDSYLKAEKQHRNIILDTINRFGTCLMEDLKRLEQLKQSKVVIMSAQTQTEEPPEWDEKNEIIHFLEQKSLQLQEELRSRENDLDNLSAQNSTLREVILGLKKERESWGREKEQMEEEARVTKLEESVRLIKNNLVSDQKDVSIWSALQDVKKEVSDLKNRKFHNATIVASMNSRPSVVGKHIVKNPPS